MDKENVKQIISEQRVVFEREIKIVERKIPTTLLDSPKIVVITGVRRCGKSTLLRQISKEIKNYGYVNFEDERFLDFTYKDFNALLEALLELNRNIKTFFFDEIQNVEGWERFVRRLFTEGYKIFVTGSNANLLSSEIATSLTGRNLKLELYPFSFKEYLKYIDFSIKKVYTTKERAAILNCLEEYINFGGFPEVVISKNFEELSELYQDIIIKDLLVRLKIRDTKDFRELALYLLSNVANKISYNKLKNILEFSNTSKVKNYVDFLTEAYMFFTVNKYSPSIRKQIVGNRKVYAVDQGIINAVAFQFSRNYGKIVENIVFLELKRKYKEIFYFEDQKECDFVIKKGLKIAEAIQVCSELNEENKKREIQGLLEALEKFNLKEGLIITRDLEETRKIKNKKVKFIPLWKWLLQETDPSCLN